MYRASFIYNQQMHN